MFTTKFYVHEIAAVNLSKIYLLKNTKKTCKPNKHDLNRNWITPIHQISSDLSICNTSVSKHLGIISKIYFWYYVNLSELTNFYSPWNRHIISIPPEIITNLEFSDDFKGNRSSLISLTSLTIRSEIWRSLTCGIHLFSNDISKTFQRKSLSRLLLLGAASSVYLWLLSTDCNLCMGNKRIICAGYHVFEILKAFLLISARKLVKNVTENVIFISNTDWSKQRFRSLDSF